MSKTIQLTNASDFAIVDDEDYDRLSQLTWRLADRKRYATTGYPPIAMHTIVLDSLPKYYIDHRNHNTLDNRRENLRFATPTQSAQNRRKKKGANGALTTSQFKGVCWRKDIRKWRAKIKVNGKSIELGSFANEEDAARAYDNAARTHFGEFASTNFGDK